MGIYAKFTHYLFLLFQLVLIFLLVGGFTAFVGVVFSANIEEHVSSLLGLSGKAETLKFVGIAMGGILVALQAVATQRRAQAVEDTVAHAEKGQRQERMKNAIEHLGHESDSVRMGGAYELFHLAKDYEELSQTVLNILCAHIRQTTGAVEYREKHRLKPSEEVQSLLTLMFFQEYDVFFGNFVVLKGSWLKGADLAFAHMPVSDLSETHLGGADISEANLCGAYFHGAEMIGVDFEKAKLMGANFYSAQLLGADFSFAQIRGTDFSDAQLQCANLASARMDGAFLRGAQLQGANLVDTKLRGVGCNESTIPSFPKRMREAEHVNKNETTLA